MAAADRSGRGRAGGVSSARLTILGAGTCIPDRVRHSSAYHLEAGASRLLIDCGPGTLHGFDTYGIAWPELTHVLVSHYHTDHVGDLSAVVFALQHGTRPRRVAPLTLVGPIGFGTFLEALARALGDHLRDPGFELRVVELGQGGVYEASGGAFRVEATATPHTEESVAYTVSGAWGRLGYTGDTGPSDDVARFLAGCDLLVCECSLTDPPSTEGHLSPEQVAELALVARPGLLAVTHVYPPLAPAEAAALVRRRYGGATVAAMDGMVVDIDAGGASLVTESAS